MENRRLISAVTWTQLVGGVLTAWLAVPWADASAQDGLGELLAPKAAGELSPDTANDLQQTDEVTQRHLVVWLDSLDQALEKTRLRRAPILVVAGADWCEPCHLLDRELESASVQTELERWIPVRIDVDDDPQTASELFVESLPALRILSADGKLVAAETGVLSWSELSTWLSVHYELAASSLGAELKARGAPDSVALMRILNSFGSRDATLRNAALTRLQPWQDAAAALVVARFREGTLAERLTALELLRAWQAPVVGIDPWKPETYTGERFARLDAWLTDSHPSGPAETLTVEQIIEVERLLKFMITSDAAAAAAYREQLARMGPGVLPFLQEALSSTDDPLAISRLLAARYRLAARGELLLNWPGGLERLAANDFDERVRAVQELSRQATRRDEQLLLALFEDSAPLIRELAIQTLQRVSGQHANSALIKLLDDPNPNVRAAVLKQLAEAPSEQLVGRIAEYITTETDPDLIVHAIRFLREVYSRASVTAMLPLFDHVSWRVRADAAEGVARLLSSYSIRIQIDQDEVAGAFRRLLTDEDSYVVSRAVSGLSELPTEDAYPELITAATQHPELADEIISVIAQESEYRHQAQNDLLQLARHERDAVRAAAVQGLVRLQPVPSDSEQPFPAGIVAALEDTSSLVRTSALHAVFALLMEHLKSASGESSGRDDDSAAAQLIEARSSIADWIAEFAQAAESRLQAEDESEQLAAARMLAVLGHEAAFEVLLSHARRANSIELIAESLPGLEFAQRQSLFTVLVDASESVEQIAMIAWHFSYGSDTRTVEMIWQLLEREEAGGELVLSLHWTLFIEYFSTSYYGVQEATEDEKQRFRNDIQGYLQTGSEWQRRAALQLMVAFSPEETRQSALELFERVDNSSHLKSDALRVWLWSSPSEIATQRAIQLLESESQELAEIALAYLALGNEAVDEMTGGIAIESHSSSYIHDVDSRTVGPIIPRPPQGMTEAMLERFYDSEDPHVLAQAGYFLTLFDNPQLLGALQAVWESAPDDTGYHRLAYRALARVNDPQTVPVLERIYQQLLSGDDADEEVKEFYWTIRTMTGPEVMALRRKIRQDHSADALR